MNAAVIPARGGSKRIPGKNIRDFAGKPIIAYSIECARRSGLFGRVVVSTDDEEIAAVATKYGAEVPFVRPKELADDYTGTTEVVADAVQRLTEAGTPAAAVCCIYATSPFVRADDLRAGLARLESGPWSYVFSATTYAYSILRSLRIDADGGVEMFFPEHFGTRSQDLPEALHDAGQFYWGRTEAWLRRERIFGPSSTVVTIPRWRVQDIDTEEDWARAELMAGYLSGSV